MFCAGMMTTDTLDSVLIHRLVSYKAGGLPRVMRVWIWSVTVFAVAVAAYEFAQVLGWTPPVPDVSVNAILVAGLLGVFIWVFLDTRPIRAESPIPMEQLP